MPRYAYQLWNHVPMRQIYFQLSDAEQKRYNESLQEISEQRRRVEHYAETIEGDFLVFNKKGNKPPIYWCFNIWAEPLLLIEKLDKEQPLYAMHSLNIVTKSWSEKTRFQEHLALKYFEQIKYCANKKIPIFGGNCQAAPIAESIAILFEQKYTVQPFVVFLEYLPRRKHTSNLLMLFGKESLFNPFYNSDVAPFSLWEERLQKYLWGFIKANHGEYFRGTGVEQLAWYIQNISSLFEKNKNLQPCEVVYSKGNELKQN